MTDKIRELGDTIRLAFASNTDAGSQGDGASPLVHVRRKGDVASNAPIAILTPFLLTNAAYPNGAYEVTIPTSAGYTVGDYTAYCSVTISALNPIGIAGEFELIAANTTEGAVLIDTTVLTVISPTVFTLTNGSSFDASYPTGSDVIIGDASVAEDIATVSLASYVASSGQITLDSDPAPFVVTAGNSVRVALASADNVSSVGGSGGGLNFEVNADNTGGALNGVSFIGTQTNTFVDTHFIGGNDHIVNDVGGAIDVVYQISIGGSRTARSITFTGHLTGNNDILNFSVWNGTTWDAYGELVGQTGAANVVRVLNLLSRHTGTGADIGLVFLRIDGSGLTGATLTVDELLVEGVASQQIIGYVGGQVWIDTNRDNTGTVLYNDGTFDNPVSVLSAARTVMNGLNSTFLHSLPGSDFTLDQSYEGFEFFGHDYFITLAGQSISGSLIHGAQVIGNDSGLNALLVCYESCRLKSHTLGLHSLIDCGMSGTITLAQSGIYDYINVHSSDDGVNSSAISFVGAGVKNLNMHRFSGSVELLFLKAGDSAHIDGQGRKITINANCTGGTIVIAGSFALENNAAGAVSVIDLSRSDNVTLDQLNDGIIYGAAVTGTLSTTICTTDLTGFTASQLQNRRLHWLDGPAQGESTFITGYTVLGATIVFGALTLAPQDGNRFKIV